jgi:hypothetical protein
MSASASRAIISPSIDPWIIGGLSLVVLSIFLLASSRVPTELVVGNFLIANILINGSHFMSSYHLLYSSREFISRYRWASIYLPMLLITVGIIGLVLVAAPTPNDVVIRALMVTASVYLALHYTGQTWGMMASFAYIHDIRFTSIERRIFRACLRTMAAWHVGWALVHLPNDYTGSSLIPIFKQVFSSLHGFAIVSFIVGLGTLISLSKRIRRIPPASVLVPFVSIYVWYAFLWVFPQSLFWVQIAHALQYLAFPARVELNRADVLSQSHIDRWRHVLNYSIAMAITSTIVFFFIERSLTTPGAGYAAYWLVISAIINIHHYFIDGCIWHISTPEVRRDLFAHLEER